jgi:hypothetical protein
VPQGQYQIRLLNTSGQTQAIFDKFQTMRLELVLNGISTHMFSINGLDDRVQYFTTDALVEVYRKPPGSGWAKIYGGFHRTPQKQLTTNGRKIFTSYGRSYEDLLNRRQIAYKGTTAYTLKQAAAETVIKEFVNENAGPGANNEFRLDNGAFTGFTVQADGAQGAEWFGQRSLKSLLKTIQEIAAVSSIDFAVVRTEGAAFEFRTYYPQKGTDLRNSLIFSPNFHNMSDIDYTVSRTEEITRMFVLGQGEGSARRVIMVQSDARTASPWNLIEGLKDSRSYDSYQSMLKDGEDSLLAASAEEKFSFKILQTVGTRYQDNYDLGYLCTVRYDNVVVDRKIVGVNIQVSNNKEEIEPILGNINSDITLENSEV